VLFDALPEDAEEDVRYGPYPMPSALQELPLAYFFQDPLSERVKIGYSDEPFERARRLCTPAPLSVVGLLRGGRFMERYLHRRLVDSRVHGEWFEPTMEVQEAVRGARVLYECDQLGFASAFQCLQQRWAQQLASAAP
jgi:hypothetical protein